MDPYFATSDPCWLRPEDARALLERDVDVRGDRGCAATVRREVALLRALTGLEPVAGRGRVVLATLAELGGEGRDDVVGRVPHGLVAEGYAVVPDGDDLVVTALDDRGLLHGFYALQRHGERLLGVDRPVLDVPTNPVRMINQWDNMRADGPMGSVERGYAGSSIFYADGRVVADRARIRDYARLLASVGINALSLNNVNVHRDESRLLTEHLGDVADLAAILREFGIAAYLSVNFAAPIELGGLATADPLDPDVAAWWRRTTDAVYAAIPDFGGYVVKADSENRPGPFSYGRDHADGANVLADALAPHGGVVFWRCFVYDHLQDWRDRSTDRARAAYDHFTPLDGRFADNVVLQVKNGPMDFQVREPVSPLIGALERTNVAVEFQVTQEYTGHQKHVCYLVPQWREVLDFPTRGDDGATVREIAAGRTFGRPLSGVCAVSNVGDDRTWTGHPLAQANLYGFGRLAWDPTLDADVVLDEWLALTFPGAGEVQAALREIMAGSWLTYERYTAPLGVGWMVTPGSHYGPSVDGYEYTAWGTYHFADRDGVGVDRTVATGTGFTGQFHEPWASVYEDVTTCPTELALFCHHLPYGHLLRDGSTVIQHIYDTHFAGVEEVEAMVARWEGVAHLVAAEVSEEISRRMAEQLRSAREWRDQVNTYFWRKSGVPDARGRTIH